MHFQPGESPRGVLRDCKTSHNLRKGSFAALVSTATNVLQRNFVNLIHDLILDCPTQRISSSAPAGLHRCRPPAKRSNQNIIDWIVLHVYYL